MYTKITSEHPVVALAAIFSILLSTSFAQAARMATIVRGTGAGSDKAAGFVAHFARHSFQQDDRYEVINLVETLGSSAADRAKRAFQVADENVQKGREAYETLDLDPAVEYLNNALAKYERHAAYVPDVKSVADALMLLGATHILRGEERTGAKRLTQAVAIYPDIEPDPHIFNPGMREIFQKAAAKINQRPPGDLAINSNPSYAEVYLDGRFVGVTPMAIENVKEGRHYVRLVKDGYRNWGKLLDVVGGSEAADTATLRPTSAFRDFDSLVDEAIVSMDKAKPGSPMSDSIDQIGVLLNIDHLFLAAVRLDGEKVEIIAHHYDLNQQALMNAAEQSFAYDTQPETYEREVSDLVRREFSGQLVVAAGGGEGGDIEFGEGGMASAGSADCFGMACEKFKLVVLAGGAGGGVVFMGLGAIMWGLAKANNNDYATAVQRSNEAASLRSGGEAKAIVGDVFFFLGAALAVAGTTLYFLWHPAPTAEDIVEEEEVEEEDEDDSGWGLTFVPLPDGAAFGATFRF